MAKIKLKGAYEYSNLDWHKNHNALVVKKAASAAIIEGKNIREFIMNHDNPYDFFLCTKVGRNDKLVLQEDKMWGQQIMMPDVTVGQLQNITRYYVSNQGSKLVKIMKPLKRRGSKVQMVMKNYRGKKFHNGMNKNLEVTNIHEFNSAIRLGYRTKDKGSYQQSNDRLIGIDKEWLVTPINRIDDNTHYDFNYEYYITEAEKLVNKILT